MLVRPPIYGLDIVVDTTRVPDEPDDNQVYVLDPTQSTVVAAGVSTIDGDEYYDGDERRILSILDQRFAVLDPGIISTWNGSIFDLPFLRARARAHRLGLGLRLRPDRRRHLRRANEGRTTPILRVGDQDGSGQPMSGAWHRQRHLDLRWVYGETAGTEDLSGMDPRRGAHLARSLAERRWVRARRHLDRIPPQTNRLASYTWTCLEPDAEDGPTVRIPASAKARHPSSAAFRQTHQSG